MKRYCIIAAICAVISTGFAQTDTATRLYKEALADRSNIEQFLKQDFEAVDSTSMNNLAYLFYRDKDYRSAGACWELALQKVKKHGETYEQILKALSFV